MNQPLHFPWLPVLCAACLVGFAPNEKARAATPTPRIQLCPEAPRPAPEGFTDLRQAISSLRFDIRYHTADNFTDAPLDGYGAPGAWLLDVPAKALGRVQRALARQGLGLVIFDAYRPRRGTDAMVAWAERTNQTSLLDGGYVARRSRHNHGTTVDLGLVKLATGERLAMGTDFDTLTPASHTRAAKGEALRHRLLLKEAMEKEGFRAYFREWWHFQFDVPGSRPRDIPYGRCEADERAEFRIQETGSHPKKSEKNPADIGVRRIRP
ncbi:MAG: hypothetical protein LBM75_01625 [Myxococcales bacterium]|jgi:D-alanyl-D-alanine dipeptidase|nr:hypothetical protein [Myxococcales bacterium]